MIIHLAMDPLPYRPIEIVDVSPIHSRVRPSAVRTRQLGHPAARAVVAGLIAATILAGVAALGAAGADGPSGDPSVRPGVVQMAPGHARPIGLR